MKARCAKLPPDLVKIKSYSFIENKEQEVSRFIYDYMTDNGFKEETYALTALDYCGAN